MDKNINNTFLLLLLLFFLFINENFVHWILALSIGGLSFQNSFYTAYRNFSIDGYLIISIFRATPYLLLYLFIKKNINNDFVSNLAWGGLFGIVIFLIMGYWGVQYSLYTDDPVSSTTALNFLIIPFLSIPFGGVGCFVGYLCSKLFKNKQLQNQ